MTDLTRSLWETDGLPPEMQQGFKTWFMADPDAHMRSSLDLFRYAAIGGADHLSGFYIGQRADGFDTPAGVAALPPSPAGLLLKR